MPNAPPASRTNSVKNAPESPMATPVTPVAKPFLSAYHFCTQASTDGARKALPSPAGRLNASQNTAACPAGTKAAATKPPPKSAAPKSPAGRGPLASCSQPPSRQPSP